MLLLTSFRIPMLVLELSVLLTDQGAQVIIPDGDLLSRRLVNWTFDEADIRLNLQLTFISTRAVAQWKQWLLEIIPSFDEIDPGIPLKIFTKDITAEAYILSVQVGIQNVQQQIERFPLPLAFFFRSIIKPAM